MASTTLKILYREARRNNVGCIVGEHAKSAWHAAKVLRKWQALESIGAVRLRSERDDDYEASNDDPEDVEAFGSIGEYRRDLHNVAPWFTGPSYLSDASENDWEQGDSVWGHVGYSDVLDWKENPYIIDVMDETIRQFREAWKTYVKTCKA